MTETVEVEVSSLAAAAHDELSQFDEYDEILSENLEDFILEMFRNAEKQAQEALDKEEELEVE